MNMSFHFRRLSQGLFSALVAVLLSVSAPAFADGITLKTEAFRDVVVAGKDGKQEKQRVALKKATPGQEVIYVITYRNTGTKPAENVVVNNPVPKGLVFQPGSAQGEGTRIEVSVDGGNTFGPLESLKASDGKAGVRAARADDVTNVRWTLLSAVKAGQEGSVTYKAVLK
jgi:uncharacterized repeat protein (TIGR01451 family)